MRITAIVILAGSLVFGIGCKKESSVVSGSGKSTVQPEASPEESKGSFTSTPIDHIAQFGLVPASAQAVATFDLGAFWESAIDHNFGIMPVQNDPAAVRNAMARASQSVFGFDITATKTVTLWASLINPTARPTVAAHFAGVTGVLSGKVVKTHEGVPMVEVLGLVGAMLDTGMLIGSDDAVAEAISVAKGKADALGKRGANDHKALLASTDPGIMTVTMQVGPLGAFAPEPINGLQGAAITMSPTGRFTTVIKGTSSFLDLVMTGYGQGLLLMKQELDAAHAVALKDARPELLPLTYVVEKWADFTALTQPVRKDDTVVVQAELGPIGRLAVPAIAVVSAIAIPSFEKYQRRAESIEALEQLERIHKGSAIFFTTPQVDAAGQKLPCRFPKSVALTPAPDRGVHPCCVSGETCKADGSLWEQATWTSLGFAIDSSHRFMYEYSSNGKSGVDARFTASAYGDLDCDGVFSTFERFGYGGAPSSDGDCSMESVGPIFKDKEAE